MSAISTPADVARLSASPGRPAYVTPSGRDLRLDFLRGLCVLVIIVDHVAGASPLYFLTGGSLFLTSAAEGFILVSGLTAGLVYRRLVVRDGLVAAMTKALSRAFTLYLLTVGLTLFLAPLSEALQLPWAIGIDMSRSLKFLASVLGLHMSYPYVDILLLYTLLFLALPLVLLIIEQKGVWVVLLASWLVWLVYQVYPEPATFPWPVAHGLAFPFSTWQLLFFTTFVLSYRRDRLPRLEGSARNRLHLLTGLAFAALVGLFFLLRIPPDNLPAAIVPLQRLALDTLFGRPNLGPGRAFASAVVFGWLLLCLTRWWAPLSRAFQGFLLPFGQHALYAWTAHLLTLVAIALAVRAIGLGEENPWSNAALQVVAVTVVWWATRSQFLAVDARNRRYWYAVPAVLALIVLVVLQLPFFDAGG